MENKWRNKIQDSFKTFNIKNDKKLVIYLISIGIASVFWFLNALEKEYTVELSFPVRYTNFPNNKILANDPPTHFVLDAKSYGFTLLRYKLSVAFSPLVFNVNDFTGKVMEKTNRSNYTISSKQYKSRLANQLSNELQIMSINPDTIHFQFDQLVTRKIKVIPNISYELKKQHFLQSDITTKPDSVDVIGPESILDTLSQIKTVSQHYKDLDQLTKRNVSLQEIEKLEFSPKRVVINIPIEEFTEKQIIVPIRINNLPDNIHVTLFPSEIKVTFMTGLSRFSTVNPQDFYACVSYKDLQSKIDFLPVSLDKIPINLKTVSFLPQKIEYLIEK